MSGETSSISAAAMRATVPTEIREEGSKAEEGYRAALEFEGMLLKEMLTEALPEEGSGEAEEEGFSYGLTDLPETVTEEIVGSGGIGMASELYKSFEGSE